METSIFVTDLAQQFPLSVGGHLSPCCRPLRVARAGRRGFSVFKNIQRNFDSLFGAHWILSCSRSLRYSLNAKCVFVGGLRMDALSQLIRLSVILIALGVVVWLFV
jgi:hypothetical protein